MGNLLTLSIAVAMLLLMSLAVSLNVFVYCLFCVSSVLGPQRLMYVLLCVLQGRLGYWNLSLRLSHSQESYKKSLVVARLRAPRCCSPSTGQVTEIEWAWIPVRPSVPPPHPVPASMSVGRRRARGFPPGQSPSPLVGAVPRPTLGFRLLPWNFQRM